MQGGCRCSLCRARRYRCCGYPYPHPYPAPNPNPALTPTPTLYQVLRLPTAGKLYGMCVSGSRVFVADYERHQVHVLQLGSGTPSSPPPQPW